MRDLRYSYFWQHKCSTTLTTKFNPVLIHNPTHRTYIHLGQLVLHSPPDPLNCRYMFNACRSNNLVLSCSDIRMSICSVFFHQHVLSPHGIYRFHQLRYHYLSWWQPLSFLCKIIGKDQRHPDNFCSHTSPFMKITAKTTTKSIPIGPVMSVIT